MSINKSNWVWSCHNCNEGRMTIRIEQCPNTLCNHTRCTDCTTEKLVQVYSKSSKSQSKNYKYPKHEKSSKSETLSANPPLPGTTSEGSAHTPKLERSLLETSAPPQALIPLIPASLLLQNFLPIRKDQDKKLIQEWDEKVLPGIKASEKLCGWIKSVHLLRFGQSPGVDHGSPIVVVYMNIRSVPESEIVKGISTLFGSDVPSELKMAILASNFRRTVGFEVPVCRPRNIEYEEVPGSGASIGIEHSIEDTATLGGYLLIDEVLHILTVDHLIPANAILETDAENLSITQPSEVEGLRLDEWSAIKLELANMKSCCERCRRLWSNLGCAKSNINQPYQYLKSKILNTSQCQYRGRQRLTILRDLYFKKVQSRVIGDLNLRSTMRACLSSTGAGYYVEMDWALFKCRNQQIPTAHITYASNFSEVVPNANVKATGRTSGFQHGVINGAKSGVTREVDGSGIIFTEEWSIVSPIDVLDWDWVFGGIGVDGDSGSWILDQETEALYGMVWARDGDVERSITLFTPIQEIIPDIKSKGAKKVELPQIGVERKVQLPKFEEKLRSLEPEGGKGRGINRDSPSSLWSSTVSKFESSGAYGSVAQWCDKLRGLETTSRGKQDSSAER